MGAAEAGIATAVIDHKAYKGREAFDTVLTAALKEARVDIVCNAGFMRLHSAVFLREWDGRQLKIIDVLPASGGCIRTRRRSKRGYAWRGHRAFRERGHGRGADYRAGRGPGSALRR